MLALPAVTTFVQSKKNRAVHPSPHDLAGPDKPCKDFQPYQGRRQCDGAVGDGPSSATMPVGAPTGRP